MRKIGSTRLLLLCAACAALAGCAASDARRVAEAATVRPVATLAKAPAVGQVAGEYYGTLEPFASQAVYFVLTDRFVNGDPSNDHREQGGAHRSFDIPLLCPDGTVDNLGYLGGDFRGLLDHADYIREMGFTAVWITPIVENPDEAFTGGDEITCTSFLTDRGKAAYHGYWGRNFYAVDEHLPSRDLDFAQLTQGLKAQGLDTVLDIVGNHSSPAYGMPTRQPGFGQVLDAAGKLVADHENKAPAQLDPAHNPLHRFYNTTPGLAQLGDFDPDNPQVMDYLVGAYLKWIGQGAAAFRVDTIREQPLDFWKTFADRIRAEHPGFFMFGEAFDHEAANIAPFTLVENGSYSVLDFPLKKALVEVFETPGSDYAKLADALYLEGGPYRNPYELTTFYDNHDMKRMDASDAGFIDAHNWLFTARGIPVIYYGSEIGFMRGRVEHHGNRNYFGSENIAIARGHPIRQRLARIARLRAASPALQRGLQVNLALGGDHAAFYRVFQHGGVTQTALVLLNKGEAPASFEFPGLMQPGVWRSADAPEAITLRVDPGAAPSLRVEAHDVAVWLLDQPVTLPALLEKLDRLAMPAAPRTIGG